MHSSSVAQLFLLLSLELVLVYGALPIYSGEAGYAMRFNYSQYVELPSSLNQKLGKSFTFEAWIRLPLADTFNNYNGEAGEWGGLGLTVLNRPIVSRYRTDLPAPTDDQNDFDFQINPSGELQLFIGGSSSGGTALGILVRTRTAPLVDNRWYHVAFTVEYSNPANQYPDGAHVYLNWEDVTGPIIESPVAYNQWQIGLTRQPLDNQPIMLGHYQSDDIFWPTGHYFVGEIDEVRFWSGARTTEELTDPNLGNLNRTVRKGRNEDWEFPPVSTSASLVAQFNFNEGPSNPAVVIDNGPFGFDGVVKKNPERDLPAEWTASPLYVWSFEYANDVTPIVIDLRSLDAENVGVDHYEFTWDPSFVNGQFYVYDTNGPNFEPRLINSIHFGAPYPAGTFIVPGNAAKVVFQWSGVLSAFYNAPIDYYQVSYRAIASDGRSSADAYVGQDTLVLLAIRPCALDACSVCDGQNKTLDGCGICSGTVSVRDACGICNGDNSTCLGCDKKPNGLKVDICGVCGGNNGTCIGCDGDGGGVLDACGVCNGDNSTCSGCDLKGGDYDYCGVCAGDNSTCTCVKYHGYHVEEMEVILMEWSLNHTIFTLDCLIELVDKFEALQEYPLGFDFGSLTKYLCEYLREELEPFDSVLDEFMLMLNTSFGPKAGLSYNYTEAPWPIRDSLPTYQETASLESCDPLVEMI